MKIIIVTPSMLLVGGIERVVSIQANYWAKTNNKVYIVTNNNESSNDSFYKLSSNVSIINISNKYSQSSNILHRIENFFSYKKNLANIIKEIRPDIIISTMHGRDFLILPSICIGIPIVAINHISMTLRRGDYLFSCKKKFINNIKYHLLVNRLKKYNYLVALSRTDEILMKSINSNTVCIPNPVNIFVNTNNNLERKKIVICVGRLDYLKGQDRLLKIWKHIAKKNQIGRAHV